ncbi:MBL-fold metallo-hydrolase superfamily [Cytobacillus firmus]|uniref:MBL-fold metallo-hydrolase superfamily n=1 Tax=Cytobacillus firmus TaxID=1399 RepID=A0A800MV68_CYTFI|nr:MBL-fold metallo-hydrolase superfamily [Cytobacillus firmus]
MGKISPEEETQREMEIGPNRCAVRQKIEVPGVL